LKINPSVIVEKLNEYGIGILDNHAVENNQHVFFCKEFILMFYKEDNILGVAFQATMKPDNAGQTILILQEIKDINIEIMEPFILSAENKLISGEDAFKLIEKTTKEEAVISYKSEEMYAHILNSVDGYKC